MYCWVVHLKIVQNEWTCTVPNKGMILLCKNLFDVKSSLCYVVVVLANHYGSRRLRLNEDRCTRPSKTRLENQSRIHNNKNAICTLPCFSHVMACFRLQAQCKGPIKKLSTVELLKLANYVHFLLSKFALI